jgi:hypothetical protein
VSRYSIEPIGVELATVAVSCQLDYDELTLTGAGPGRVGTIMLKARGTTVVVPTDGGGEILFWQPTIAAVPIVGRVTKHPRDRARYTVDFTDWVDPGELLVSISDVLVTLLAATWAGPYPPSIPPAGPVVLPPDPTPLTVHSAYLLDNDVQAQVFVDFGTDGNTYALEFTVGGTSGRAINVRVDCSVRSGVIKAVQAL